MKPHEYLRDLPEEYAPDLSPKYPRLKELGSLLDDSESVWRALVAGQFEANEHGYVKLNVLGWSKNPSNPDSVSCIQVFFIDPSGKQTVLGRLDRERDDESLGSATKQLDRSHIYHQYMAPEDESWDVVVGTIERAIAKCKEQARDSTESSEQLTEYLGATLCYRLGYPPKQDIAQVAN